MALQWPVAYSRKGPPCRRSILKGRITDIVDYPKPGVVFKDITTLLKDPDGFEATIDSIAEHF